MNYQPLPEVPQVQPQVQKALEPVVRSVILLLVAFAFLNIAREVTYLIGSMQSYGRPQFDDIGGVMRSLMTVAVSIVTAYGLRRYESWARHLTIGLGSLWAIKVLLELLWLLGMRAMGHDKTEVQIALLGCMVWTLAAAVVLLLTAKGKAPFANN